jgi:hypothetical protein
MKKLPKIQWSEIPQAKKAELQRWLEFRRADLGLRSDLQEESEATPRSQTQGPSSESLRVCEVAPFDEVVALGQIRLLAPELSPDLIRPLYFAVLREWDAVTFLIAPFSPYCVPATEGELLLASNTVHFQVICLWNARTVSKTLVAQSWIVGQLTEKQLDNAWAVFKRVIAGHSLPEFLEERVGLPIYTSSDPRIAYEQEEASHLEHLVMASERLLETASNNSDESESHWPELVDVSDLTNTLAWAAAVGDEVRTCEFTTPDGAHSISFSSGGSIAANTILVAAYDAQGEPSALLEGAQLLSSAGQQLAFITNGTATVPKGSITSELLIRDKDGRTIRLQRKL